MFTNTEKEDLDCAICVYELLIIRKIEQILDKSGSIKELEKHLLRLEKLRSKILD